MSISLSSELAPVVCGCISFSNQFTGRVEQAFPHAAGDKPQGTLWTVNCPNVNFNFAGYGISVSLPAHKTLLPLEPTTGFSCNCVFLLRDVAGSTGTPLHGH